MGEQESAEEVAEAPVAEAVPEPVEVEAAAPVAPVAVAETETTLKPVPQVAEVTAQEPAPAAKEKEAAPQQPARRRYRYVEDERVEAVLSEAEKRSGQRKRSRELVLDEESGQLISRPRHKKRDSDDEFDWEESEF